MSNTRSRRFVASALIAAVLLAGCGSDDEIKGEAATDGLGCQPARVEPTEASPEVDPIDDVPKEVATDDVKVGEGCDIARLDYVSVNLVGAKADGTEFVNTWTDGRPLTVTLGSGELLPGLELGLAEMKVGGTRQITLPADQAYGADGNEEQGIGPDEDIRFVVELLAVSRNRTYCRAPQPLPEGTREGKPESVDLPVESPTELVIEDIEEGSGDTVAEGNWVSIEYVGVSCTSGAQFDSSWDREATFDFTVGEGTIEGMAEGVIGAKKGSIRRIEIPSHSGYGPQGRPPEIAADDPLVFFIEVVDVKESAPVTTLPPDAVPTPEDTAPEGSVPEGSVPEDTSTTTP